MQLKIPISKPRLRNVFLAGMLVSVAALTSGCAGYYQPGYSRAYYAPDYTPYYADYGYGGDAYPYGGYDEIVVGGRRHGGYYGHHHLGGEFGARARAGRGGGGAPRGGGGNHGGGGGGHGGGGGGHR